jgi:flagellar basal-body rod protein FlgC
MDFSAIAAISESGMNVERTRLDVAAINLANTHTSRVEGGGPFKPLRVVSGLGTSRSFSGALFANGQTIPAAKVLGVEQAQVPPRLAFEPGHPDADAHGFVAYPGVDPLLEMVNLMTAQRAYEANVMAINAAKAMASRAMDIGGGS